MARPKYDAPAAAALLDLLEGMVGTPGDWGPTELAKRLNLSPNLAFRVLTVMTERGYAVRNAAGRYELTSGLYSLGMRLRHRFALPAVARPFLERLAEATGEACQLQAPAGGHMLVLDCVAPPTEYYLTTMPGARLTYHGNAFGKAVLAYATDAERDRLLEGPLARHTAHTVVTRARLDRALEGVRASGVGEEFDEYVLGIYCLASPVFDAGGAAVAAAGIAGMTSRLDDRQLPGLREHVARCADAISQALGHRPAVRPEALPADAPVTPVARDEARPEASAAKDAAGA